MDRVTTLDLQFQDCSQIIASYLIPHEDGMALVETGPGSTFPMLQARLAGQGLTPADVTEVLLTHIHLDHAGAAGHLAKHGATVYVHEIGAPHMTDPDRLMTSARRIYGDDMDRLWGDMYPVPEHQLVALEDEDSVTLGNLEATALDTPGHASHHMSYLIDDVCFTGDVGGVRMPGERYVELPLAPPEIRLDLWRQSVTRLQTACTRHGIDHLAATHFGIHSDVSDHLDRLRDAIDAADAWVSNTLPDVRGNDEALQATVTDWMRRLAESEGVDEETWNRYELANPSWMAALGLQRYWQKHRS